MGTVRLLPLLAIAAVCLFLLKAVGLMFSSGYMLSGATSAIAQNAGQDTAGNGKGKTPKPDEPIKQAKVETVASMPAEPKEPEQSAAKSNGSDTSPEDKAAASGKKKARNAGKDKPIDVTSGPGLKSGGAEVEVLQSLSKRRKTLDKQARELQLRENLMKAAEKRVEGRIAQLKALEQRIENDFKRRENMREAEYKKLVVMYSRMKPKKAARIFNRLNLDVLTQLVRKMKPASTSPILAAMDPAVAERVTMEIAVQGQQVGYGAQSLPKISGESAR